MRRKNSLLVADTPIFYGEVKVFRNLGALLAVATLATTCSGTRTVQPTADRCPEARGEFPFTDCAILAGKAVGAGGTVLAGLPVRVDSFVPFVGYAYSSESTITDQLGAFELLVYRVNRLQPVTTPDTATVEVKAYQDPNPIPGAAPIGRAQVVLWFAPLGTDAERTKATTRFDIP